MKQVRDVMTTNVESIKPDTAVHDAATRMKERNTGFLPVVDNDKIAGVVTDRDITLRVVAEGKDPKTVKVSDIMTRGGESCKHDSDLSDVVELMKNKRVRRVLVMDDNDKLAGVLSLGDVAIHSESATGGEVLEEISSEK